jgi:hypothetical protein
LVFSTLIGISPADRSTGVRIQASLKPVETREDGGEYLLASKNSPIIRVGPGTTTPVVFTLKNTSQASWDSRRLRLGSAYTTGDPDRVSVWADASWVSATRIAPTNAQGDIRPGETVSFYFTVHAPSYSGLYKETFRPLIEDDHWLEGEQLSVSIEVLGGEGVQSARAKELRIYISTQTAELVENGFIVANLLVSTGKAGYDTPLGSYTVFNQFESAKSQKYKVWMGNWMGIVKDGETPTGYGMHSLAYWPVPAGKYTEGQMYDGRLYTNGRLYEDIEHLGTKRSHGCIRFNIYEASVVYGWADIGTPVIVI